MKKKLYKTVVLKGKKEERETMNILAPSMMAALAWCREQGWKVDVCEDVGVAGHKVDKEV
jgi:hypothetical protein